MTTPGSVLTRVLTWGTVLGMTNPKAANAYVWHCDTCGHIAPDHFRGCATAELLKSLSRKRAK